MAKFAVRGADAGAVLDRLSAGAVNARRRGHHLHPVARRGRRHPGRPHRDPAGARRLPRRRVRHRARAGARPAAPGGGRCRGDRRRRHHRPRAAHRAGPRVARHPGRGGTGGRLVDGGLPVPGGPPGRRSPGSTCWPSGSPTSASSAGSCTHPPTARSRCGTPCSRRVRRTASGRPACGRCRACGWRRATATTATTSTTPTTCYAVGLGFAVALDKPGGFTGREATLAAKERGTPHHRLVQVLLEDPEPLLFHAEPVLRDGVVVGLRAGGVVRLDPRRCGRAWPSSVATGRSRPRGSPRGRGRSTSPARGTRRRVSLRPMYDPTSARVTG